MAVVEGQWRTDPEGYRKRLIDLVGDRKPLDVLAATADTLMTFALSAGTAITRRPDDIRWSANEVLGHLVDVEIVLAFRTRAVASEDEPQLLAMDQDLWVERQQHNRTKPTDHVDRFRSLRELNLELWRALSRSDLKRVGQHDERGPESLGTMLHVHAGHDLLHIHQAHRILAAVS